MKKLLIVGLVVGVLIITSTAQAQFFDEELDLFEILIFLQEYFKGVFVQTSEINIHLLPGQETGNSAPFRWQPERNITITKIDIHAVVPGTSDWAINLTRNGTILTGSGLLTSNNNYQTTDIDDTNFGPDELLGLNVTATDDLASERPYDVTVTLYWRPL